MKINLFKIKLFRYIAHFFGVRFWRESDIERVTKEAEEISKYFNSEEYRKENDDFIKEQNRKWIEESRN